MKTLLLINGLFLLLFNVQSQAVATLEQEIDTSIVTIYEYGQPIDSCECNFENLFRNWTSQFVTNAVDIKLISYEFVEQLNDNNINSYIDLLNCPNTLSVGFKSAYKTDSYFVEGDSIPHLREKRVRYILLEFSSISSYVTSTISAFDREVILIELENKRIQKNDVIHQTIKKNDKVYLVTFKYGGQVLKNYVICSHETNRVIWDNIFDRISCFRSQMLLY